MAKGTDCSPLPILLGSNMLVNLRMTKSMVMAPNTMLMVQSLKKEFSRMVYFNMPKKNRLGVHRQVISIIALVRMFGMMAINTLVSGRIIRGTGRVHIPMQMEINS